MTIAKDVKKKILEMDEGKIITFDDLACFQNFSAVASSLSRLVKAGILKRLGKGRYFKPVKSKFGERGPSEAEIIKSIILEEEGSYISGGAIYNQLGITNQVPNEIVVIGKKCNRKTKVGRLLVKYKKRNVELINKDKKYLQILDAIQDIKKISEIGVNEAVDSLVNILKNMKEEEIEIIINDAQFYKPMVRALLGAILEKNGHSKIDRLKQSLNPLSSYKIGVDEKTLPNIKNWRIS
jgi:hypothetical protein